MVTEEIVYKMFPETAMNTLDDEIALSSFSIHNYVATCLQQVFLPWPLSLLHLLPDWLTIEWASNHLIDLDQSLYGPLYGYMPPITG